MLRTFLRPQLINRHLIRNNSNKFGSKAGNEVKEVNESLETDYLIKYGAGFIGSTLYFGTIMAEGGRPRAIDLTIALMPSILWPISVPVSLMVLILSGGR